jgi:predicted nucleic acid-binding protein
MGPVTVFLDSNVIFSIAWTGAEHSRAHILFELQQLGKVRLFISPLVMEETLSNISAKKPAALPFLRELLQNATLVPEAVPKVADSRVRILPDNDRMLLQTAIAHGISWFVTGNSRDFQQLYGSRIGNTEIATPRQFLESGEKLT